MTLLGLKDSIDAKPGPSIAPEACGRPLIGTCFLFISIHPSIHGTAPSLPNLQGNLHSSSLPIDQVFILEELCCDLVCGWLGEHVGREETI